MNERFHPRTGSALLVDSPEIKIKEKRKQNQPPNLRAGRPQHML